MDQLELLYKESLERFNENSESRGFYKRFSSCPRALPIVELGPNACPNFKFSFAEPDILCFEEHTTTVTNLPSSIFDSLNPWWNENITLKNRERVFHASENVLCMVFRKDENTRIAVMYDIIADKILGVVWLANTELYRQRRFSLVQCTISSDGSLVGMVHKIYYEYDKPSECVVYILGLNSSKSQSEQEDPTGSPILMMNQDWMNSILGNVRVYSTVHHIFHGIFAFQYSPIRIDFIPSFHSCQYLICNVMNFPDKNGNNEHAFLAKMDIRSKEQTALAKLNGTQMAAKGEVYLRNIVFARDGELIIACLEEHCWRTELLANRSVIISTATLDVLASLEHALVSTDKQWKIYCLCYVNVTPLTSIDGRCVAIASGLQIIVEKYIARSCRPGGRGGLKERAFPDYRPETMMNVYCLPVVLQSLQSLAKLCIKQCTRNNPNKIKQLALPPSLLRYVYDC